MKRSQLLIMLSSLAAFGCSSEGGDSNTQPMVSECVYEPRDIDFKLEYLEGEDAEPDRFGPRSTIEVEGTLASAEEASCPPPGVNCVDREHASAWVIWRAPPAGP